MTAYTINVVNQSTARQSYALFIEPPGVTAPADANIVASFENVPDGGWDSLIYTPEGVAPRFLITEGVYAPGEVIDPPRATTATVIDFTGRSQYTATVTERPDGGFTIIYN
jgi:hypothetical protein